MTPGGHVHIISTGKGINPACPAILYMLPTISHTCVLDRNDDYTIPPDSSVEKERLCGPGRCRKGEGDPTVAHYPV